jgi:ribonuclease E
LAEYTREVHEEYAVQRWPETKRLLGLLVNSAGGAHARNARRLVHAARKQDRRLAAALLAAALAHTPEAEEVLRGARTRMARKPPALARELLRNFPKRRARGQRRRRRGPRTGDQAAPAGSNNGKATRTGAGKGKAPSDAVLTEALSNEGAAQAGMNGELEPGSGKKLQRNVEEALDRADQPTDSR